MKKYDYESAQTLVNSGTPIVDAAKAYNIPVGNFYTYRSKLKNKGKPKKNKPWSLKGKKRRKPGYLIQAQKNKPAVTTLEIPQAPSGSILCFYLTKAQLHDLRNS